MSGHTPGPWRVLSQDHRGVCVYAHPFKVASVWGGLDDDTNEGPTTHANASLIAAAPELLMALKQMDGRFRKSLAAAPNFPDADDERALDAASEAIAKAEGEVQS